VGFRLAGTKPALGWPLATLAALALDAFPGATGHAAAASGRGLAMLADTAHVVAAGAWIGTLGLILALERRRPGLGVEGNPSLLGRLVPLFSPVAMVGVGFLAASGIYAAWRELEAVSDLWLTGYGRLLVLKLLLVASVLALGAWNWRRLTPRLSNEEGQSAMRRAATTEFLIANLVLVITALLIRTSPGGH